MILLLLLQTTWTELMRFWEKKDLLVFTCRHYVYDLIFKSVLETKIHYHTLFENFPDAVDILILVPCTRFSNVMYLEPDTKRCRASLKYYVYQKIPPALLWQIEYLQFDVIYFSPVQFISNCFLYCEWIQYFQQCE